jgi:outer membrane protein OmpA-like peptidoglycan-associated protein
MKKTIVIIASLLLVTFAIYELAQAQLTNVVVALTGNVMDQVSKEPVNVRLECWDQNNKRIYKGNSNAAQGGYYYMTGLKPGQTYTIKFSDLEYFKEEFTIEIPSTDKYQEFSRDFLVKPKEVGLKIPMKVPPFELNKSKLRAGYEFFLRDILKTIELNRRIHFEIVCYPDNDDDPTANKTLTEARASALMEYFRKNGVAGNRVTVKGNTATDPNNPPPTKKRAKGKRYIGSTYFVITQK